METAVTYTTQNYELFRETIVTAGISTAWIAGTIVSTFRGDPYFPNDYPDSFISHITRLAPNEQILRKERWLNWEAQNYLNGNYVNMIGCGIAARAVSLENLLIKIFIDTMSESLFWSVQIVQNTLFTPWSAKIKVCVIKENINIVMTTTAILALGVFDELTCIILPELFGKNMTIKTLRNRLEIVRMHACLYYVPPAIETLAKENQEIDKYALCLDFYSRIKAKLFSEPSTLQLSLPLIAEKTLIYSREIFISETFHEPATADIRRQILPEVRIPVYEEENGEYDQLCHCLFLYLKQAKQTLVKNKHYDDEDISAMFGESYDAMIACALYHMMEEGKLKGDSFILDAGTFSKGLEITKSLIEAKKAFDDLGDRNHLFLRMVGKEVKPLEDREKENKAFFQLGDAKILVDKRCLGAQRKNKIDWTSAFIC